MANKNGNKICKKKLIELLTKSTTRNIKVYHNTKTNVMRVEYQLCDIAVVECDAMSETDIEMKLTTIIETLLKIDKCMVEGRLK